MIITGSGNLVPSIIPPTITLMTDEPITVFTDDGESWPLRMGKKFVLVYNVNAILTSSVIVKFWMLFGKTILVRLGALELSESLKIIVLSNR